MGETDQLIAGPPQRSQQAVCSSFPAHQRRQDPRILPIVLRDGWLNNDRAKALTVNANLEVPSHKTQGLSKAT
jgi:hypothetical protein